MDCMRIVTGLLALAGLVSPLVARAQARAPIDQTGFDQADRRSRALLSSIRCARWVSVARAQQEFGPIDSLGHIGQFTVPDTGVVNVPSRGTTVPSLSELVLANGLNDAGRSVAIQWAGITSALVGRGDQAVWMHLTRKP
jgi:hypothetical protein